VALDAAQQALGVALVIQVLASVAYWAVLWRLVATLYGLAR